MGSNRDYLHFSSKEKTSYSWIEVFNNAVFTYFANKNLYMDCLEDNLKAAQELSSTNKSIIRADYKTNCDAKAIDRAILTNYEKDIATVETSYQLLRKSLDHNNPAITHSELEIFSSQINTLKKEHATFYEKFEEKFPLSPKDINLLRTPKAEKTIKAVSAFKQLELSPDKESTKHLIQLMETIQSLFLKRSTLFNHNKSNSLSSQSLFNKKHVWDPALKQKQLNNYLTLLPKAKKALEDFKKFLTRQQKAWKKNPFENSEAIKATSEIINLLNISLAGFSQEKKTLMNLKEELEPSRTFSCF